MGNLPKVSSQNIAVSFHYAHTASEKGKLYFLTFTTRTRELKDLPLPPHGPINLHKMLVAPHQNISVRKNKQNFANLLRKKVPQCFN